MEVISKTPGKLVLRLDVSESLANAIRRSVAEVPTLAISEVEIFKNDSALYDELLSHRLGLVPLKTEKSMNEKTKIDLKIKKVGPGVVYSGDLEGGAEVVEGKIPLVLIGAGHSVELVATATLGKGVQHAKHTPGLCYYRHLLEVSSSAEIDKIVQRSKGEMKPVKSGSKWVCDLREADVDAIKAIDKDAVKDMDDLVFVVESYGVMPAQDIFQKAIEALTDNADEFLKELK
ncbi:MAG TPA: DNA-directed RNA polymerase subunit D [Candidatus Nanoarchaeia archaeon]|nr:DNA-directed RNA polymerase subunit D [Candidatus Nanoarchaeia archaeon]